MGNTIKKQKTKKTKNKQNNMVEMGRISIIMV
jgi:hypothetical protein